MFRPRKFRAAMKNNQMIGKDYKNVSLNTVYSYIRINIECVSNGVQMLHSTGSCHLKAISNSRIKYKNKGILRKNYHLKHMKSDESDNFYIQNFVVKKK